MVLVFASYFAWKTYMPVKGIAEKYKEHNIYPSTNTEYIYAIIATCLELKGLGLSDKEIIYCFY